MKLRLEQLGRTLQKSLHPVYLISGDEPLLVQEAVDQIRAKARNEGFTERKVLHVDRQFNWSQLSDEGSTMSLFAEKKIIELRLGKSKPGTPGAKALNEYLRSENEDNLLIVECERLDASTLKSKWIQNIETSGVLIQVWPIGIQELPTWLKSRATKSKLNIEDDAISLLCDRLEGNLLAAVQELEKLKLNHPDQTISAEHVQESVQNSSRYDIFKLTDACLNGESVRANQILSSLKSEGFEPSIAIWSLTKEVRLLESLRMANSTGQPASNVFKKHRVIQKRQSALSKASNRMTKDRLQLLLNLCADCDAQIKGFSSNMSPWDTLLDIALLLSDERYYQRYQSIHFQKGA